MWTYFLVTYLVVDFVGNMPLDSLKLKVSWIPFLKVLAFKLCLKLLNRERMGNKCEMTSKEIVEEKTVVEIIWRMGLLWGNDRRGGGKWMDWKCMHYSVIWREEQINAMLICGGRMDNLSLCFPHVGPGTRTQVVRIGGQYCCIYM